MTDWYRRKTWTKLDEAEFFAKLARARYYGRAQYLRIQAYEFIETRDENLLSVAETLLYKILTEYPDNRTEKSDAFNSLGEIFRFRKDYKRALEYFKKALDFEKEFPYVRTQAYLNFSETVVQANRTELFDEVERLLIDELGKDSLKFPVQNYIMYSVLSIISGYKGDSDKASLYADLAEKSAAAKTKALWNPRKRTLGIVKERKSWLDRMTTKA